MIFKNLKVNENLSLIKFSLNYVNHDYFNWFKDKEVKEFIRFSPKNIQHLKKDVLKKISSKSKIFLAIQFQKKNIGNVLINDINYLKKSCNIGILIGEKSFRNKNIGTKVLKFLTEKIFSQKKINKIFLGVDKKNIIAIKSYLNVGFKFFKKIRKKKYILVLKNNISNKLVLGTAQFGMPYGISNNINRKVNIQEQNKIFNLCNKFGINEIDTAQSYNFDINALPKNNKWLVNTKIEISKFSNKQQLISYIKSFKKSNITLNCLYIHDEENLFTKRGIFILKILLKLKKSHFFNKLGVSIYNFSNLRPIIKNYKIDVIQVPFNILDRRIKKYVKILKKNNIDIHVRSIFLQGLLLMKPSYIPSDLSEVKTYIRKIIKDTSHYNTDLINYFLNFVCKHNYIKKIIFGVHTSDHLKKIIKYKKISKIRFQTFNVLQKKIINPTLW
jgi:aryl-alcohol dehydrogenase-like predicted oxidoreductase/RimJ/RimL family protein N-acetyltransferase